MPVELAVHSLSFFEFVFYCVCYNFLPTVLSDLSFWNTYQLDIIDLLYWFSNFPIFCLPFSFSVSLFYFWDVFFNCISKSCHWLLYVCHTIHTQEPYLFPESCLLDYLALLFYGCTVSFYLSENLNLIFCLLDFFFDFSFSFESLIVSPYLCGCLPRPLVDAWNLR